MPETISVLRSDSSDLGIIQGIQTTGLLERFTNLNVTEKNNLLNETVSILSKCRNPEKLPDNIGSTTGIAIGYVQSGKTMSFTTLTALAVDNGYRIIIYFAGIKNNLLEQTTKRLKKDLLTEGKNARAFKIYPNPTIANDIHLNIKGSLRMTNKPAILITVLKHYKHIAELTAIFKSHEVKQELGNTGVLIIDDEADQASLNTYARSNSKSDDWEEDELSSTYASILGLKDSLPNHSYIQYTATPQAPLLINIMDLLSPKFHVVLTPGESYTGGKIFFKDMPDLVVPIPIAEVYHHKKNKLEQCPESLIQALQLFLMQVAIVVHIEEKENFLSMLIHADREKDASRIFLMWVKGLMDNWQDRFEMETNDPGRLELVEEFRKLYPEAVKLMDSPPEFETVMESVEQVALDCNTELVISDAKNKNSEIDWSNSSAHILVGAEMLNRGYTVEGLAVSYMPRNTVGKSNADTIQQRCRFFGYKRNYLSSCRVFLPEGSIHEYEEYVDHEEIMRAQLKEHTLEEYEQLLILSPLMNPTRNNILSVDLVKNKLSGWRQFNALQHIEENMAFITQFFSTLNFQDYKDFGTPGRRHRYVKLSIKEIISFLKDFKIANMPDALRKSSTIQYLRYLEDEGTLTHAYIFEMAYEVTEGRKRDFKGLPGQYRIGNIFSGPDSGAKIPYPGDTGILIGDSLTIQVHKIRLKHEVMPMNWDGKLLYTLGINYPPELAHAFVGIAK